MCSESRRSDSLSPTYVAPPIRASVQYRLSGGAIVLDGTVKRSPNDKVDADSHVLYSRTMRSNWRISNESFNIEKIFVSHPLFSS